MYEAITYHIALTAFKVTLLVATPLLVICLGIIYYCTTNCDRYFENKLDRRLDDRDKGTSPLQEQVQWLMSSIQSIAEITEGSQSEVAESIDKSQQKLDQFYVQIKEFENHLKDANSNVHDLSKLLGQHTSEHDQINKMCLDEIEALGIEKISKSLQELDSKHEKNYKICLDGIQSLRAEDLSEIWEKIDMERDRNTMIHVGKIEEISQSVNELASKHEQHKAFLDKIDMERDQYTMIYVGKIEEISKSVVEVASKLEQYHEDCLKKINEFERAFISYPLSHTVTHPLRMEPSRPIVRNIPELVKNTEQNSKTLQSVIRRLDNLSNAYVDKLTYDQKMESIQQQLLNFKRCLFVGIISVYLARHRQRELPAILDTTVNENETTIIELENQDASSSMPSLQPTVNDPKTSNDELVEILNTENKS